MRIRLATADDLPAILDIANHAALTSHANFAETPETLDHWRAAFEATRNTHPWLVAHDPHTDHPPLCAADQSPAFRRTNVVGFAKASPWLGRCAYRYAVETTVYTRPGFQGAGLGRSLMAALLEALVAQGYRTVIAGVSLPNDASVRLHESLGYARIATLSRVGWKFGRWWDVGYWQTLLPAEGERPPAAIRPVSDALRDVHRID
jgi:phosphinothricin acetyltransferase